MVDIGRDYQTNMVILSKSLPQPCLGQRGRQHHRYLKAASEQNTVQQIHT